MESFAAKERTEKERKEELKRQIAALQEQLPDSDPESPSRPGPSFPKRRKLDKGVILAPRTPSPRKTRRPASYQNSSLHPISAPASSSLEKQPEFVPVKPAASTTLLSKLAHVNRQPFDKVEPEPLIRSSAFTDTPRDPSVSSSTVPQRDDRLAIVETLDVGPVDHKPPFDDPYFQQLEPNSRIRLSSRVVPHEDIQDHLRGRYYLSPSRLYSAVRLLPDKQGYDVPVAGDWITIAVMAERGPYKYSKAPVEIIPDEDDRKGKAKAPPKPSGKKFINIKLVDFGAPARSASSATGGKAVIRGDAMLSLLLFESDGFETVPQEEGQPKKVYRGGSRGAFEQMCDLKEGDVVALLNPRILKPFQRSNNTPHPTTNVLAITPESALSILVIGRAKDLGLCVAVKRDGKVCKSWCDTRVSDVCEWHLQHAVEQRRANRPEFTAGTSGMSMTAGKRKADYDPRRKWGLKPLDESLGATYLVSGHIIHAGRVDLRDSLFVSENIGREGQAKAARKLAAREDAQILKVLQGRDAEGMKAVMKAREVGLAEKEKEKLRSSTKGKQNKSNAGETSATATPDASAPKAMPVKSAFSAQALKHLGFDPTIKPGQVCHDNSATKKKMEDLAALQASWGPITLKPRAGEKVRSGVVFPSTLEKMVDLDDF
ncbi:hypothetical protein DFH08DRAFT_1077634 [Mycena albidolilacea]|uniref:Zinc finger Mcm10/DnaG-type domain-containing protein n=1 Tax=Mycena albidolilacea TaxID=1033008 RepID=A0AAD7AAP3_9AGAR|nr:hypothetical protein DFH08DRAFT_1077634 [Mycena albidolilacea]